MKIDDDSGEADEPPGCANRARTCEHEENGELQRARRHVPEDRAHHTELTIDRIDRRISSPGKEGES